MVKKAKKRGVKPGTKRGKYKRHKRLAIAADKAYDTLFAAANDKFMAAIAPTSPQILNLCGQLEEAIVLLEDRIGNSISKINSLMGNVT